MKRALLLLTLFVSTAQAFASPQTQPLDMQTYQINNLGAATSGSDAMRYDQFLTPVPTATAIATATPIAGTGLLAQTAANTFVVRTITSSSNNLSVTNGDGVSGNPVVDFPAGATWTPTFSQSGTMTFGSTSIILARYYRFGKLVFVSVDFSGTTGGTPTNQIQFTLPVTSANTSTQSAFINVVDGGSSLSGYCVITNNSTTASCRRYDAAVYGAGSGREIFGDFVYEGS